MSELQDRLRAAEARAASNPGAEALAAIGVGVSRRAFRRRLARRAGAIAAAAGIAALAVSAAWPLAHRSDPVAPEPSPSVTAAPAPVPTVSATLPPQPEPVPSPVAAPVVPYTVTGGVTVSQYLPAAQPVSADVWGKVSAGWILAVYEGGLLDSGRTTAGILYAPYSVPDFGAGDAVAGPRVLYLVAPTGEVYEVANLTDLGVGDVLAWDVGRGVALVADRHPSTLPGERLTFAALDLRKGALGRWFVLSDEKASDLPAAVPVDGGWLIGRFGYRTDTGDRAAPWPAFDPFGGFSTWVGGRLVTAYPQPGNRPYSASALYLSTGGSFPNAVVPGPGDPNGNEPIMCWPSRLASPAGVVVQCGAWQGTAFESRLLTGVWMLEPATGTLTPVLDWGTGRTRDDFWLDGATDTIGCIDGGATYGMRRTLREGSYFVSDGLQVVRNSGYVLLAPPEPAYMALDCVGSSGGELVIRGVGAVWVLDPAHGTWRTALSADALPASGGEPTRYVAGVTDFAVLVAP